MPLSVCVLILPAVVNTPSFPASLGNIAARSPPVGTIKPLAPTNAPALIKFLTWVRAFKIVLETCDTVLGPRIAYLYNIPNLLVFKNWLVVSNKDS